MSSKQISNNNKKREILDNLKKLNNDDMLLEKVNNILQEQKRSKGLTKEFFNGLDKKISFDLRYAFEIVKENRMNARNNLEIFPKTIKDLKSSFTNDLISTDFINKLDPILNIFPDAVIDVFIFEITDINKDESYIDFSLCLSKKKQVKRILSGKDRNVKISNKIYASEVWENIKIFWKEWDAIIPKFKNIVSNWLEFDVKENIENVPIPAVFINISNKKYENYLDYALAILKGKHLPVEIIDNLKKCFKYLPENAKIFSLGLMHSRKSETLRIAINKIKKENIIPYLKSIGYSENIIIPEDLDEAISKSVETFAIAFDIGKTLLPRISIELTLKSDEESWKYIFDYLEKNNLCTNKIQKAIYEWPAFFIHKNTTNSLPTIIYKYFSHLKIIFEPDSPIKAKAYFGVSYS